MSTTAVTTVNTVIAGITLQSTITRTQEAAERVSLDVAAGLAGTLTTRTDADTGVFTVETGHGITTSDTVSVFFADGTAYNGDVTAVTATTITVDFADGADLPVVSTAVVVSKQVSFAVPIIGNSLRAMVIKSTNRCLVDFRSSAPATLLTYLIAAAEGRHWFSDMDVTNPLAGDTVATVHVANGDVTANTIEIGLLKSGD